MGTETDVRITLVQCDLAWENPQINCEQLEQLLIHIDSQRSDLIVLPEMFATGFTMNSRKMAEPYDNSPIVMWMQKMAKTKSLCVTGSVAILDNNQCFNRMIWCTAEGEMHYYDKRHLFRMAGEHERYAMGLQRKTVQLKGFSILLSVCYDLRFPVWMRQQPQQISLEQQQADSHFEYDLILCVANWPAQRSLPWRSLLQARAIENLAYVVGVNRVGQDAKGNAYSGDSMLINYKGDIICDADPFAAFIETVHVNLDELRQFRAEFPAWQDADEFTLSLN